MARGLEARRGRRVIACGATAVGVLLPAVLLLWLGVRLPWARDPLTIGAFEELLEAQGFAFADTDQGDGLDGYVLRRRDKGQWAERIYVHPQSGARIELRRGYWHGGLQCTCTVTASDAGARLALVRLAGEFSPYLTQRIAQAEAEYARTGRWVRVTAPDFDIAVTADTLRIDSRPGEYVGMGRVARAVQRLFWRLARLAGRD